MNSCIDGREKMAPNSIVVDRWLNSAELRSKSICQVSINGVPCALPLTMASRGSSCLKNNRTFWLPETRHAPYPPVEKLMVSTTEQLRIHAAVNTQAAISKIAPIFRRRGLKYLNMIKTSSLAYSSFEASQTHACLVLAANGISAARPFSLR